MFGRSFWMLLIVGAAIGIPYVVTEWSKIKASVIGQSSPSAGTTSNVPGANGSNPPPVVTYPPGDPRALGLNPPSEETPMVDMAEAFRFSVSPPWVLSRWPRVSAGLPDETYHGLRVPLITGMRDDDLAGALTYYFTPTARCAKITFSGTTGDPRRVTAFMMERFGFKAFTNGQPGVQRYEIRWNGTTQSEMLIHPAAIVRATNPLARYEVQIAITDPAVR
jgi:hypothetical protein